MLDGFFHFYCCTLSDDYVVVFRSAVTNTLFLVLHNFRTVFTFSIPLLCKKISRYNNYIVIILTKYVTDRLVSPPKNSKSDGFIVQFVLERGKRIVTLHLEQHP